MSRGGFRTVTFQTAISRRPIVKLWGRFGLGLGLGEAWADECYVASLFTKGPAEADKHTS